MTPDASRRAARAALREVHARAYRWPPNFAGFAASVEVRRDGEKLHGSVTAYPGKGATFDGTGDEPLGREVAADVITVVTRLMPRSFEDLDGAFSARFAPSSDRLSGRAIELIDDPRRTVRWIDAEGLAETEYDDAVGRVGVAVLSRVPAADGRSLPSMTSEWAVSDPTNCRDVFDEWATVGGVPAPARRAIVPARAGHLTTIVFSGHSLLPDRTR